MRKPVFLIFFPICCALSCTGPKRLSSISETLERKSEPWDMFAFQRSYPDSVFDWKGWREMIGSTRAAEQHIAAESRSAGGCESSAADWTLQGPGNVGGRANALAVKPGDDQTLLAGFAGGGIFKSTDGGVSWRPVFDEHTELAVGDITYDPSNTNVVYAGTGDPNMPSIVFNGNGIYKSVDGGESWNYLAMAEQGIISKILVHPANSNILYAASMGNPYVRDNHRGVYKSVDGGQSWQQVLFVSNQAGASDLAMAAGNPQILYASFWDRVRSNKESIVYGPNAKIYKSTDGGANWTPLGGGLPTGVMGRTGLALSQQNPDKLYAVYIDSLSTTGGVYKSVNGGASWTDVNSGALETACSDFGWYFGKLRVHPTNDEELYFLAVNLWRKASGSNVWQIYGNGHADSHDFVITPGGTRYWASDGGVYRQAPNAQFFTRSQGLPTTQLYHTTYNLHQPNTYYIGTQDNGVQKGNRAGYNTWTSVFSADGFRCAFLPSDPNTFWVEIQNGVIHKTVDNAASWQFGSNCLGTNDRCNWDTPYFLSKFGQARLIAGTYRVYSNENGAGWSPISGDLTDGIVFGARFHNVTCVAEAPGQEGKLMAGTSDGNVWRRDQGGNWTNVTAGLPDRYVTSVHVSPTNPQRLFVTHSGFRNDEEIPHIHRSDNNGAAWLNISSNLPQAPVNDLLILEGHADSVLFAATDAGVYWTRNGGASWSRLGEKIPYVPVFDLEENPVKKQLLAATFARGLYTFPLDSVFLIGDPVSVDIAGQIATEAGVAVSQATVSGVVTDPGGVFELPDLPGCSTYVVAPYRNDNPINGVSTFDLVLITKHILAIDTLDSPYKIIAADANKSGSVTTFDVVTLRKLILGIDTAFAANTSWRFVPADHVFSNVLNPFAAPFPEADTVEVSTDPVAGIDFTGIKVGDVNGSVQPLGGGMEEEKKSAGNEIHALWNQSRLDCPAGLSGMKDAEVLIYAKDGRLLFQKNLEREKMLRPPMSIFPSPGEYLLLISAVSTGKVIRHFDIKIR